MQRKVYTPGFRAGASCAALLIALPWLAAAAVESIHYAVGPRLLYPDTPNQLLKSTRRFLDEAEPLSPPARLLACVAPHSAFGLSGPTAALAFKDLKPGQYKRVIVLAPSHYATFEGCSIAAVEAYETPLGLVPVDRKAVRELTRFGLISSRAVRYRPSASMKRGERDNLHEAEHSIEMVLPFLQLRLGYFELVPILVGNLNDAKGKPNENIVQSVANVIKRQIDGKTLIVVSTDLTHYGDGHGYRPFETDIEARIDSLDEQACAFIRERDYDGFQDYLKYTRNPICGQSALRVLFKLLPEDARGLVLGRAKEADVTGNMDMTVSYAAINFYDASQAPLPGRKAATVKEAVPAAHEEGNANE